MVQPSLVPTGAIGGITQFFGVQVGCVPIHAAFQHIISPSPSAVLRCSNPSAQSSLHFALDGSVWNPEGHVPYVTLGAVSDTVCPKHIGGWHTLLVPFQVRVDPEHIVGVPPLPGSNKLAQPKLHAGVS
jgi:hypothetical protein